MKQISKEQKSNLARLLATENLNIEHRKVKTAYFIPKTRTLCLPIWENMSNDLYDLLCGHEVGHALYTPQDENVLKEKMKDIPHSYFNVIEDIRIDMNMKKKYPGLRKSYFNGYKELVERKFFGNIKEDANKMRFIDRLNIYTKSGNLENSEDVEGVAKSILGDTANSMSGKQIEDAVLEALAFGGQRNSISNGIIIPNPAHTIIRDSETANARIGMSKMLLETIESGAQTLLTRKPLVTGPGVAAQSLFARGIGGFRELVGLVDPDTKSFNLNQNNLLTAELTKSLGDNIDDRDAIIGTITAANKRLNDYMEDNKNADGSYTDVALATYQLRMEQTFIAYQTAKFFGDSRVSNADFKNAFDAMFATFEVDPEKQRKAFATGLMRLHFLVGKQVEDDALQTRFARALDPQNNPKVMYDISANSGAKQYMELLRKTSQALVSNDQPDQYFGRVFPPEVYSSSNYRPFVQPVAPEVELTVEDLGATKGDTANPTTEVNAKPN